MKKRNPKNNGRNLPAKAICVVLVILIVASVIAPLTARKAVAAGRYEAGTYVTGSRMKVRGEAAKSSEAIGSLKKGAKIDVSEVSNTVWGKVTVQGKTGYVHLGYCRKAGSGDVPSPQNDNGGSAGNGKTCTVISSVYVRTEPNVTTGEVLGCLGKGKKIRVEKTVHGWAQITFRDQTGYVYMDYLKAGDDSNTGKTSYKTGTYTVNTGSLRVRDTANLDGKVVAHAKKGTTLKVTRVKGCWGKVTVKGKTGYVCLDYCKKG